MNFVKKKVLLEYQKMESLEAISPKHVYMTIWLCLKNGLETP